MRLLVLALGLALGCKPDLGAPPSLVTEPRILAVRGEPPEAAPGEPVAYEVLLASPDGAVVAAPDLAFCTVPKPLVDNNSVAAACAQGQGLAPIGDVTMAALPKAACSLFGPDTPPSAAGQPSLRPRDPDVTGGFYQPVRVAMGGDVAFGLQRLRCNLANAPVEVSQEFRARYVANQNPTLAGISLRGAAADGQTVTSGEAVTLVAEWTSESAESFPVFDPAARALVDQRDALRVSWFATAGTFDHDHTGRDAKDLATTAENRWHAPSGAGAVYFWAVLRDSRRGVAFRTFSLTVQ